MIDYKYVIESLIEKAQSFGIEIKYTITESSVKITFPKGFTYRYNATPQLTNESYKHLLEMMFMQLVKDESRGLHEFPIKIIAVVFHERGSSPYEVEYDPTKSVQQWHDYFQSETKKVAKYPIVFYIQKVYSDRKEAIYLNTDVIKNLASS